MKSLKIIFMLIFTFLSYGCATESEEIVHRPSGPTPRFIYLEQESIIAYLEVTNIDEYKNLIPSIFSMPEKPQTRQWGQIFILDKGGGKGVSIWLALKRTESKVKDKDLTPILYFWEPANLRY